jgi:general stress protein 26
MPTKPSRKPSAKKNPAPTKVHMPAGYTPPGTKSKFLTWEWVTERLERSHNYWICSTFPDGRPHATPVWGLWHDGAVVFSTDPSSRKARNLRANPAVLIHPESGDETVILEGQIEVIKLTPSIDDAYNKKYKMRMSTFPMPFMMFRLKPRKVMAWREKDFATSATKWNFN